MKNANPKSSLLHGFIYIMFLKCQNYRNKEQISGCQRVNERVELEGPDEALKGQTDSRREPCNGSILYLGCVNINILVVIWYIILQYHIIVGNWVKVTQDHSIYFFITICISTIISNKIF